MTLQSKKNKSAFCMSIRTDRKSLQGVDCMNLQCQNTKSTLSWKDMILQNYTVNMFSSLWLRKWILNHFFYSKTSGDMERM